MKKFYNEIKFVPSTPKTFQVLELRGQQQQPVKKSGLSAAARSKIVNRSGSNYLSENQSAYGPCESQDCVCHIEQGFVSLHLACPATNCSSSGLGEAYQWVHGSSCGGPIYINGNADLKCMTCEKQGYITNWSFKCSQHPGEYLETTNDDCINALGTVLRLYPNKPDAVKRVVRRVITKLMDNEGYTAGSGLR